MRMRERGIALVITLIVLAVFSVLGLGLVLTTFTDRMTDRNYVEGVQAVDAADAALEIAARELSRAADWNLVLGGTLTSAFTDGPPGGPRTIEGLTINLTTLTNQITCGRTTFCTDARLRVVTSDRPWGANNPRWQLFVYGPLATIVGRPDVAPGTYIVVWIGDDARELDGDPLVDGGDVTGAGRDVVRARAEAFTGSGAHRIVEGDLVRQRQGIRVQSWRVRTAGVP